MRNHLRYLPMSLFIPLMCLGSINSTAQSLIDPNNMVIGLDSLPTTLTKDESFIFYNSNKSAFRGGKATIQSGSLKESEASSTKSISSGNMLYHKDSLGMGSFAFGQDVLARGAFSTALGINSRAIGDFSLAIGSNAWANAPGSMAFGQSFAVGPGSVAMQGSQAIGTFSLGLGYGNTTIGTASVAIGTENTTCSSLSMALGQNLQSNGYNGLVIGRFNDTLVTTQDSIDDNTPLFIVGNGSFKDTTSASLFTSGKRTKSAGGNSYLTTSGILKLNNAFEVFYDGRSVFKPKGARSNLIIKSIRVQDEHLDPLITTTREESGYIGTQDVPFNSIFSKYFFAMENGNYMTYSDARLKKNITDLDIGLSVINKLRPVKYNWIQKPSQDQSIGLIAQEVEAILPQLVREDLNGTKAVGYEGIIPYLIKGMQEQNKTIEYQGTEIKLLNQMLKQLIEKE